MPDTSNKNDKNQNQTQKQGNQGNLDSDKGQGDQDFGGGRQVQSDKGNQAGKQGSTNIEETDTSKVSNDNEPDTDSDSEDDKDSEEVTQRNPRMGDQGQSGSQVGRNQSSDRDRK